MDESDFNALVESWEGRVEELEEEREERRQQQDPMVRADTPAVRERVSFDLQVNVLERCIEEVEDCTSTDEVLETLGEWRDEVEERDKRILDRNEWFRNHYTRLQLKDCVDDLIKALPDGSLTECARCGGHQLPTSDKRRSEGYRLECPSC